MSDFLHDMLSLRTQVCAGLEVQTAHASSALVHRVRWHTGLSREAFAQAFRIDLQQLRALKRGEAEPDSAMTAYLTVIDRDPDLVRRALKAS